MPKPAAKMATLPANDRSLSAFRRFGMTRKGEGLAYRDQLGSVMRPMPSRIFVLRLVRVSSM
jgi:hypothetical protein